jgi:hypothetical protein
MIFRGQRLSAELAGSFFREVLKPRVEGLPSIFQKRCKWLFGGEVLQKKRAIAEKLDVQRVR